MSDKPKKDLAKDPVATIAMGMKLTVNSQSCWRAACSKEQRIREEWLKTYRPDVGKQEDEIVTRFKAREEERKQLLQSNPDRALLLEGVSKDGKGRIAYLKSRRGLTPQERFGDTIPTASMETGWRCQGYMPERTEGLPSYGRKPVIKNGFFRRTIGGSLSMA